MKKFVVLLMFVFAFVAISSADVFAQEQYIVDPNTIALWHFNEGSGAFYADETGDYNLTSPINTGPHAPTWTPAAAPLSSNLFALDFDGINDFILTQHHPELTLFNTDFTIEAWVRWDGQNQDNDANAIIAKRSSNGGYKLSIRTDGKLEFEVDNSPFIGGGVPIISPSTIPIGEFKHVAVTYNQATSEIRLYINNSLENITPTIGNISIGTSILTIGRQILPSSPIDNDFNGIIDEVRLSNVTRDPSEFSTNPSTNPPLPCYEGTVNAGNQVNSTRILKINDNVGQGEFPRVQLNTDQPFNITIDSPPAIPNTYFILYAFAGEPSNLTTAPIPILGGSMCFPTPLHGVPAIGSNPLTAFNTLGFYNELGIPVVNLPLGTQTPFNFEMLSGVGFPTNVTLQGFVIDPAAPGAFPLAITNAIVLEIVQAPPPPVPPPPLVAHWKFDEGTGTTTADATGNGNTGTLVGNPLWTTDSFSGFALDFDGIDDRVNTIHAPSVDVTDEVLLEAYVKLTGPQTGSIISKNGPYFLGVQNQRVRGAVYSNDGNCPTSCTTPGANSWTYILGSTNLQLNTWYKLSLRYDGTSVEVYVNDVFDGSAPKTGQMPQVSQNVFLGWGEPGVNQYFKGIMDEVKIFGI